MSLYLHTKSVSIVLSKQQINILGCQLVIMVDGCIMTDMKHDLERTKWHKSNTPETLDDQQVHAGFG